MVEVHGDGLGGIEAVGEEEGDGEGEEVLDAIGEVEADAKGGRDDGEEGGLEVGW